MEDGKKNGKWDVPAPDSKRLDDILERWDEGAKKGLEEKKRQNNQRGEKNARAKTIKNAVPFWTSVDSRTKSCEIPSQRPGKHENLRRGIEKRGISWESDKVKTRTNQLEQKQRDKHERENGS